MADEKKIIEVEVREKGLDELNADLARTEQGFKDVDAAAGKTSGAVDDVASNGGAIAILDSLTGGLATRMRDAYEATKLFNFSLKGTKTALIATGIGALVVALGLIVVYWDEIVEFIHGANKALQKQLDLRKEALEDLEAELALLEVKEKILELEGKSTAEIREQREKILRIQIEQGLLQAQALQTQLALEESKAAEAGWWEIIKSAAIGYKFTLGEITEEENTALRSKKEEIDAITLATENARLALLELLSPGESEGASRDGLDEQEQQEPLGVVTGVTMDSLKDFIDIEAGLLNAARKADLEQQSRNANAKLAIAEDEFFAKQELLFASADGIMALGDLVGEQTGKGKALAAAGALISTYAAIAGQLKAFAGVPVPGYAIAQAIATGLVGFAAVKNILKTPVPNSSVSSAHFSGGSGSLPAPPAVQQPNFNIVGDTSINQLADVIAEQERKPLKAYVLSEDIENQSQLDRRIEQSASIG